MKKPPPPKGQGATLAGLKSAIAERDEIVQQIATLRERELVLRKYIAAQLFPNPNEGVNRYETCGIEAKLTLDYRYKVLEPEYLAAKPDLLKHGVPVGKLIVSKPELVLKEYRRLTGTHRKLFDRVLSIKPAETPKLEVTA